MRIIFDHRKTTAGPYIRITTTEISGCPPGTRYDLGLLARRYEQWYYQPPTDVYRAGDVEEEISEMRVREIVGKSLSEEVLPGLGGMLVERMP